MEKYAQQPHVPYSGCVTADAIEGYFSETGGLDYRREHFASPTFPLTFGKDDQRPALSNQIWDFHKQAWQPLVEQYKVVTYGNANGYHQCFTQPFDDIPMVEGDWDPQHPARVERYMRTMAYDKIWRFWHANGPDGEPKPPVGRRDQHEATIAGDVPTRRLANHALAPKEFRLHLASTV